MWTVLGMVRQTGGPMEERNFKEWKKEKGRPGPMLGSQEWIAHAAFFQAAQSPYMNSQESSQQHALTVFES